MAVWLQLEDQSLQMEQLRQELDARREELEQAQRSLSHAKQVRGWGAGCAPIPVTPQTLLKAMSLGLNVGPSHQCQELGMSSAPLFVVVGLMTW